MREGNPHSSHSTPEEIKANSDVGLAFFGNKQRSNLEFPVILNKKWV
jgi:hypothetical protein